MKSNCRIGWVVLVLAGVLPLHGQTLIRYPLNASDVSLISAGVATNSGTLGNGITNGTGGVAVTTAIPTIDVPPGSDAYGLVFSGTSGFLSPGTQQLNNTAIAKAGGFTCETWFNWNGSGTVNAMIDYAGTQKLIRQSSQSGPQMEYYNTNDAPVFNSIGSAAANQWHYAAVVFTATGLDSHTNLTGNFTFYLDTNSPTGFVSGAVISPYGDSLNRTIGLGTHPIGSASDFFHGSLYEPRVTLGALPPAGLLFNGWVVTNPADSGAGTLRDAIAAAPGGAGITFSPALNGQTIVLESAGPLAVSTNLIIDASSLPNGITISGGSLGNRILEVGSNVNLTLNGLTLSNGLASGGAVNPTYGGGAILNGGNLTLNNCTVENCQAANDLFGGGILTYNGSLTVSNSTFYGNAAFVGGGLYVAGGTCALFNSTFFGNSAPGGLGGAIANFIPTASVNNCTIAGNSAGNDEGGIFNAYSIYLTNTIVAGNTGGLSPNINPFSGTNNLTNGDPRLSPPGYYGGPTMTMPPLAGSPALDAGTDAVTNFLLTDQRGLPRLSGAHVDIGAVEGQVIAAVNAPFLNNLTWTSGGGGVGGSNSFQFAFTNVAVADFCVVTSTNVALPLASWTPLGEVIETLPGHYQFTDRTLTNGAYRFYRVVSP